MFALLFYLSSFNYSLGANPFMKTGFRTSQPIGHYEFCQRLPNECNQRSKNQEAIKLTQEIWEDILFINYDVNNRIKPATDMELYGKEEYWAYPIDAGDCEDYVLLKQRELHQRGLELSNLLITVVRKPNGEGHAVLTVRTDRGDFILDNLRNKVLNWKDTEYLYLKRQSTYNTGHWISIEQPEDLLVGSVKK